MIIISNRNPWENPILPIEVYFNLYKANNYLLHALEEELAKADLTLGRLCLLVSLKTSDRPMLPSELGDDLAVTRANISSLLRTLEKLEMIQRDMNPDDRRQIFVQITEKGSKAIEAAWPLYEKVMEKKMEPLSEDEKISLKNLLGRLGK